ncbi:sulfatase [Mangrovibacterium sp.]|uniref:sulfatase family protein n=1 Tax=Mangrovibacterium sp. TaxID=1961364 RepID=UPI0035632743
MKQLNLSLILSLLAAGGTCSTSMAQQAKSGDKKPNIIILLADDLGWGDVAFNGNTEVKTPNLDKMSTDGVQFTRYYTASPLCSPTRGSILTGRHPFRFGVLAAHTGGMRVGEVTIPEICQKNDYATGFFGKWHLGWVEPDEVETRGFYSPPWQHGYDEAFATKSAVPTWNPTKTPAHWNGFGAQDDGSWGGSRYVQNGVVVTDNLEGDDSRVIMDRAIPFIEKAVKEEKPFLATIWFHAPHEPVAAGPEYLEMYKGLEPEIKRHYYGCITAMDEQIGRLRQILREMGIEENTMIFFSSDNGPADPLVKQGAASAGTFRGHKHMIYEGGIRVPSLLVWPGNIEANKKVNTRMCSYDYLPTIVDLANLKFKMKEEYLIDGISMKPAIENSDIKRDTTIFSAWLRLVKDTYGKALVGERFKLLYPEHSKTPELYDLQNDPDEKENVIDQFPAVAEAMIQEMKAWEQSCLDSQNGKDYTY